MTDVQPYAFGRAAAEPAAAAAIGGLDKLGDRLARKLRALIEPYCGSRPGVTAKAPDSTMFMMWDACVPGFVSLSLYRLLPIKGVVTLRIDAALVSQLVDRFYGGRGNGQSTEKLEFTPTEARLINRLSGQIIGALVDSWAEITRLDPILVSRETGIAQAEILPADADVVVQSFEIDLGTKDKFLIEVVYPHEGLAGIEMPAGTRRVEEPKVKDHFWQAQLDRRIEQVRLPVKTVLARPNLKMSELMALKPGDVIPVHIARNLPLIVGDRVYAHGTVGEQDGVAAFMIEKLA
ncbi:MAG: FliM/FliN family flagellar motor switch protein [Sphingobium sp.]|nr:FliM/FliN family flagellar motor switch protein [Sphingobium sp.]